MELDTVGAKVRFDPELADMKHAVPLIMHEDKPIELHYGAPFGEDIRPV